MAKKTTAARRPDAAPARPLPPPEKPQQGAVQAGHAGAKVTVACKLPNGILLRVFDWIERDIPVMGGGVKTVRESMPMGEPVMIRGNATPHGEVPTMLLAGGYALTPNVDKETWLAWLKQNEGSDLVKQRLIFAHDRTEHAEGQAREQASLRSGLEPVDPGTTKVGERTVSKDPRMPRGTPNLHAAQTHNPRA